MRLKNFIFPLVLITMGLYGSAWGKPVGSERWEAGSGKWSLSMQQDTIPDNQPVDTLPDPVPVVPYDTSDVIIPAGDSSFLAFPADSVPADTGTLEDKIISRAADSITYLLGNKKLMLLQGDARVQYLDIDLKGEYILINNITKEIFAKGLVDPTTGQYHGRPVLTQGGKDITADSLKYNFDTKRAFAWEGLTEEGEGYVRGGQMKLNEEKTGFVQNSLYTTCDRPHPHYGIRLYKTKVTDKRIITGPANLYIEDIPLPIAIPFGFFPKTEKQTSGIIIPSYRDDATLGFALENFGYYLGLGEHFDLSLLAQVYTLGSWGISARSTYNVRYRFNGGFSADYMNRKIPDPNTGESNQQTQFNIRWNHSQSSRGTGENFSASVNAGTSKYYQSQPIADIRERAQNTLSSSVSYSKTWQGTPFSLSASANHNQETNSGQMSLGFPTLSFNVARISPFDSKNRVGPQKWYHKIGMSYSLNLDNRVSAHESEMFTSQMLDKLQTGISHSIPVSTSFNLLKYLNISPSINYRERWTLKTFRQRLDPYLDQVVRDTVSGFRANRDYSMSVSMNTRLYGFLNFKKGKIKAIRHVLTPNVSFSYSPDFGDPSFGYYQTYLNREGEEVEYSIFSGTVYGGPGSGLSQSISFGIDNLLEMKVQAAQDDTTAEGGLKKIKLLDRLSINSSYNFAADSFKLANFNFSGSTTLFEKLNISFNGTFDPYAIRNGRRVDEYQYNQNGKLARLTNLNFSVRGNFTSQGAGPAEGGVRQFTPGIEDELYSIDPNPEAFVDFEVPWSINFGFSFNYRNPGIYNPQTQDGPQKTVTQALDFNGDFSLTPKWKISYTSSYDFQRNELGQTRFSIFRDLHCWTLSFDWVPFGPYKSYGVDLRVKASILRDLKLTKRQNYYNYQFR